MKHSEEWGWTRDTEVDSSSEVTRGWLYFLICLVCLVAVGLFYTLPIEAWKKLKALVKSRAAPAPSAEDPSG